MEPKTVLEAVGDTSALENVGRHWEESMAAMPPGSPEFLLDPVWRENVRWCGFEGELDEPLARAAAVIRGNEALRRLAWHAYWRVFLAPAPAAPVDWPEPVRHLGDDAGLFYLIVGVAGVPLVRRHHRALGIPENVTRETTQQVKRYCDDMYRAGNGGRPGLYQGQMGWLRHYTREKYVRLGRLEYWLGPNPYRLEAYRSIPTGRVAALAADGTRFTENGLILRDPARYREGEGWTATLLHGEHTTTGWLIDPDGFCTRRRVGLPTSEWTCVLKHEDPVLMMHIPSGGRMTPEACRDSLERAAAFFPEHFPDEQPRAVVCTSWIFSPVLQKIFPPEANLCMFQKELYLFPAPSGAWDGLWFVFLRRNRPDDLSELPRKSSLQRGIADYLRRGKEWYAGGMFLLMDDIPRFGSQFYRSNRPLHLSDVSK
ncbi:MAG: hypothetical protein GXP31_11460 [Kiritimatiellaeota bacterium]|nr:hypothetical protein [Kiritimatiellota bacterium]